MALTEQVIDVPLSTPSQIIPKTAGLTGVLQHLIDGQVVRFQGGAVNASGGAAPSRIRVDKRDGFATLSDVVRDTADGTVQAGALLDGQTLLTEFMGRLLLLSKDTPHVYSDTTAAWERHAFQLPVDELTQDYVHTSNTLSTAPDMAHADGVSCYTWFNEAASNSGGGAPNQLAGCYFTVIDGDGVTLRAPTRASTTATRIKVVSDGAYFWVFCDKDDGTGNVLVSLLDRSGVNLTNATFACTFASDGYTDVTSTSFGILYAQGNGAGVQFSKLTYDASTNTITRTSNTDTTIAGPKRIGFLTNGLDGFSYLATSDHVGANNNTIRAYRITSGLAKDTTYAIATAQADEPANLTGYVVPGTISEIVVVASFLDTTPKPLKNFVRSWYAGFGGSGAVIDDMVSMNLASRAFALRGRYYVVGYYPSDVVIATALAELPNQPTFFLIPLNNAAKQPVAGRWDYALAYADWQVPASRYNFALASCVSTFIDSTNGMRVPLSYRAESFTSQRTEAHGDISVRITTQGTTVGVKANSFVGVGQAVELATTLLLPGPGASSWSGGEFSESGINLAPEQPTLTLVATSGTPTPLTPGVKQYVVVYEWTDTNGERVRSRPSPARSITVGANQYVSVGGSMLHATNKKDVLIAIYATDMLPDSGGGFVPSTLHYKVTLDAPTAVDSPLYNDPNQATWTFADANLGITGNEILYTDKGQLESYPAPPFARGCVWQGRACVIGPDRAIWISGPRTEGDATWFHPGLRLVLPSGEQPTAIAATTESYLLVFCGSSMWYYPAVALPDSAGANGSLPDAVPLKFNMGCTGQALTTGIGTVFSSSNDSAWLIPRDLGAPVWLAKPLADALGGAVRLLAVDGHQRIYVVSGDALGVYDLVSGCWYEWSSPANMALLASFGGTVVFADGSLVWRQNVGSYVDTRFQAGTQSLLPYNMFVALSSVHFGAVRNFASLLEVQVLGETHEAGTVTMSLAFDDNPDIVESTTWVTDPAVPFEYSYGPANQLCSAVAITLQEATPPQITIVSVP